MRAVIGGRRLVWTGPDFLPRLTSSPCSHRPPLTPSVPTGCRFLSLCCLQLKSTYRHNWRLRRPRRDLLRSRNFAQLPNLIFLVSKIKQSSQSKHHRLTSQPKAEEKCLMLNFLAPNRIYEHFLCFHFFPQSLLFLTPQS